MRTNTDFIIITVSFAQSAPTLYILYSIFKTIFLGVILIHPKNIFLISCDRRQSYRFRPDLSGLSDQTEEFPSASSQTPCTVLQ